MAFYKQDIVDINLNTGSIFRSFLNHSIGFKNDDADRFGIRCFRDGEPVDLSGASCQAVFMAPNGVNIALTSYGTVSGNVAYVTLPPACYDYEGQFCLSIQLVGGGVTGTMRIVDGMVVNTGASGAVAPTASVPTYQEIIAQYDAMVAATSAANLAIAETFDATKAYPAGKYVINEGHLYRLTADHAANVTWADTSKVTTNFGDDLTALKSALSEETYNLVTGKIASAIITPGGAIAAYSGYDIHILPVTSEKKYTVRTDDSNLVCGFFSAYPGVGSVSYNSSRTVQTSKTITAPISGYMAFWTLAGYEYAQAEEGETLHDYLPHLSATDYIVRKGLAETNANVSELEDESEKTSGIVANHDKAIIVGSKTVSDSSYNGGETIEASATIQVPLDAKVENGYSFDVLNKENQTNKTLEKITVFGNNLLDYTTLIANKYIDQTDGGEKTAQHHYASPFIAIDNSKEYITLSNKEYGLNFCRIAFYNSSKVFLTGKGYFKKNTSRVLTVEIPSGAKYIRISNAYGNSAAENQYLQVEYGDGDTPFAKYKSIEVTINKEIARCGAQNTREYGSDKIKYKSGVFLYEKRYGRISLNENLNWYAATDGDDYATFYITGFASTYNALYGSPYSSFGVNNDATFDGNVDDFPVNTLSIASNGNLSIKISKSYISSYTGETLLAKFKAYLASKPIYYVFRLTSDAETTEVLNAQQELIADELDTITTSTGLTIELYVIREIKADRIQLEFAGKIHHGGWFYTAFGSGVMVNGIEYHFIRCAKQHTTVNGQFGNVECYIKGKNGEFSYKNLGALGLDQDAGEFRDLNASLPFDGTTDIIVSGTFYTGQGYNYKNYVFRLSTPDLAVKWYEEIESSRNLFSWGNYIFNSEGNGMKAAYDQDFGGSNSGVFLFIRNSNDEYDKIQIFAPAAHTPNEVNIGYYGNKLVAICRQAGAGALITTTEDLTGRTGWAEPIELPFWAMAPNIAPYTPDSEPFVFTFSSVTPDIVILPGGRLHRDVSITATFDLVHWHSERVMVENRYYGGYNSFVKNANGYGMLWYDDYNNELPGYKNGTDVYYKTVSLDEYLTELPYIARLYQS